MTERLTPEMESRLRAIRVRVLVGLEHINSEDAFWTLTTLPQLIARLDELEAEVKEYREALSPFALLYGSIVRESCGRDERAVPSEMPLLVNGTQWLVGAKNLAYAKSLIERKEA